MAIVELHRMKDRAHLPLPLRVERLEEDADVHDAVIEQFVKRLDTVNARLTGILISLVVASIMLAANLVVGR